MSGEELMSAWLGTMLLMALFFLFRVRVIYSLATFRLVEYENSGAMYIQRKVGRRWIKVVRCRHSSDGVWAVNRLQWPRKIEVAS